MAAALRNGPRLLLRSVRMGGIVIELQLPKEMKPPWGGISLAFVPWYKAGEPPSSEMTGK